MKYAYNDGGRRDSGRMGSAGDCVCRAIAIASGKPYAEVYAALAQHAGNERKSRGKSARNGIHTSRRWFKSYMRGLGFRWFACMGIGTGCKVHLTDGELPAGRLVVAVSKHYTAVVDGVIHDTHDPQREVAMFRQFPGWRIAPLKPGEQRNHNGIFTVARRCVYGYWEYLPAGTFAATGPGA